MDREKSHLHRPPYITIPDSQFLKHTADIPALALLKLVQLQMTLLSWALSYAICVFVGQVSLEQRFPQMAVSAVS